MKVLKLGVLKKGIVTKDFPRAPFEPFDGALGAPAVDPRLCACHGACDKACPTGAITVGPGRLTIDLGRCILCGNCARTCPSGAMIMTKDYHLAARTREGMVRTYDIE
jgi:formate hydrogenlyase subunit 6/NADH:ubiquinone oxidoreductase subunit I